MTLVQSTKARGMLGSLIDKIYYQNTPVIIQKRHKKVVMFKYPEETYNPLLSEMTNISAQSGTYDFLKDDPDMYSLDDLKVRYV